MLVGRDAQGAWPELSKGLGSSSFRGGTALAKKRVLLALTLALAARIMERNDLENY